MLHRVLLSSLDEQLPFNTEEKQRVSYAAKSMKTFPSIL